MSAVHHCGMIHCSGGDILTSKPPFYYTGCKENQLSKFHFGQAAVRM